MKTKSFLLIAFLSVSIPLLAQTGNRGNAEVRVNLKRIRIDYGRPALDGRDSWDMFNKAPAGTVWRMGTDAATEILSTGDLDIAGKRLAAGRYSLWVRKLAIDRWSLSFHPKTGIPGLPEPTAGFLAEAPLALSKVDTFNDQLLILLEANGNNVVISIYWGSSKLEGNLAVLS